MVLIAVLIGASLLGVLGALVAIPVAGGIQIFARDWWRLRKAREPRPGEGIPGEVPGGA
jgi:predicted PurR-regulated permease PerM